MKILFNIKCPVSMLSLASYLMHRHERRSERSNKAFLHHITNIYPHLPLRPTLERLELLDVFLEFLFRIGPHIQMSTMIPITEPITIPAMDPASRPVFPVIAAVDEIVAVLSIFTSDQTMYGTFQSSERRVIPIAVVVTVTGAVTETDVTVAVVAAGVAVVPLHCPGWRHVWPALQHFSPHAVCPMLPLQIKVIVAVVTNPAAVAGVGL